MIKTKKLLASLSMERPALEVSKEGQLRGGFNASGVVPAADATYNENRNHSHYLFVIKLIKILLVFFRFPCMLSLRKLP